MSIGLYMDVHVPEAITVELRLRDIDVLTAQEDGMAKASDLAEWESRVEYLPLK